MHLVSRFEVLRSAMISIVISEKGGAERREIFDHDEITVGRVKGNDVLLPKGNVSKQHARVIVRDGRYIVTDLKSTNGTYVNHRRISHATLIREGDRIYIGDFILRIDSNITGDTTPHEAASSTTPSPSSTRPDAGEMAAALLDPPTVSGVQANSSEKAATRSTSLGSVQPSSTRTDLEVVSHFPLENDPDIDDGAHALKVPKAPRMPRDLQPTPRGIEFPSRETDKGASTSARSSSTTGSFAAVTPPLFSEATPSTRTSELAVDDAIRAAHRELIQELVRHVEETLPQADLDQLPRPTDATASQVKLELVRASEKLSTALDCDLALLCEAARLELLGLGPLELLLADESMSRIRVAQRSVSLQRRGQPSLHEGVGYGSERSVLRTVQRLCADAGKPVGADEFVIERDLGGGRTLSALLAPAALDGAMLQIRRTRSEAITLNVLVRGGAVSRGMATFLSHAMAVRANVLVVGSLDHGVEDIVSALCSCAPQSHNVLAIGEDDFGGRAVRLASRIEDSKLTDVVRAAARMAPDHLFSRSLTGEPLAALFDTISEGQVGVVLANPAATLRQAVERIATDVAGTRALGMVTARDWICNAFDLAIEVSRLKDGRIRVIRIAELKGTSPRDVFTFTYHRTAAGGAIEGSFTASGVIPRLVEDLAARGVPLDTAIFRRHPQA